MLPPALVDKSFLFCFFIVLPSGRAALLGERPGSTGMLVVESVVPAGPAEAVLEAGDVLVTGCSFWLASRAPARSTVIYVGARAECSTNACPPGLCCMQVRLNGQIVTDFLTMEALLDDNGEQVYLWV